MFMLMSMLVGCTIKDPFNIVGEKKIYERKKNERIREVKVSGDFNDWAIHATRFLQRSIEGRGHIVEDKEYVLHNGRESKGFDHLILAGFSPNGRKFAYIGGIEGKWFVVINGREVKRYDALSDSGLLGRGRFTKVSSLLFSPDSRQFAYVVMDKGKSFIVLNDEEHKKYDSILTHVFSPDSKKLAYAAKEGGNWFIRLNDKEGKRYDNVSAPVFSPDGSKLAYIAREGEQYFAVVNGEEGKRYDKIAALPIFSPDSRKFAYFAMRNTDIFVVINAREFAVDKGSPESGLLLLSNSLRFSPNGKTLAYKVESYTPMREGRVVTISGTGSQIYPDTYDFSFSPDGTRFASVAKAANKYYIVANGEFGKRYSVISSTPIFSPDNGKVTYVAEEEGASFVVTNEAESERYDEIISLPQFCSDSKKILYVAKKGSKMFVVVNDKERRQYDEIIDFPRFSPNCKKVGYFARAGNDYFRIVEEID